MKKLIIALFAFAAMFAVAGSASAVTKSEVGGFTDSDTDIWDATNAYTVSAVLTDTGNIDLIVDGATVTVFESVETSIDSLVGVAYQDGTDNVWYAYTTGTQLHAVRYEFKGTAGGEIADTIVSSDYAGFVAMSKDVDTSGYPVFVSGSFLSEILPIMLHKFTTAWGGVQLANGVTGPADVFLDGANKIAHAVYFKGAVDDVHSSAYDYSTTGSFVYADVIVDNTLTGDIQSIVVTGMDNARVSAAYQAADNSLVFSAYDGTTQYNPVGLAVGAILGGIYDAYTNAASTTQLVFVAVKNDDNYLTQTVITKGTGAFVSSAQITNSNTSYIADIDLAGFNSSNQTVTTFTLSDISLQDGLYSTTNAGTPSLLFLEQEEGSSIPELPGNSLWKVLIAVLALGLVVGIAAFMKKKKK